MSTLRKLPDAPAEVVVHDRITACPYLAGRAARMPLRLPVRSLGHEELDRRLASGDRRQGWFLYRTACPECAACEPLRLAVRRFRPSRSQKRALARGDREFQVEIGPAVVDGRRVDLYNAHREGRALGDITDAIDEEGYRAFLVHTCCDTFEMRYRIGGELVGVALVDRGASSLSAVYCFYDPAFERLSPGVYSIMKQIELCRAWELEYLYLGLYVAESPAMSYKAGYRPHERRMDGEWVRVGER